MERTLEIPTAEAIDLRYDLAGLGSRFLALAIDTALQVTAVSAIALVALLAAPLSVRSAFRYAASASALGIALVAVAVFVVFFGYYIIFESWWGGQTPGKRAIGVRVMRLAGIPVDINAAIVRNVVRILEAGIGLYVVSALVALRSSRNQRLGDYAAGTIVVWDRARAATLDDISATRPARDGLSSSDRALIEGFLRRREEFDQTARRSLAEAIAERVRPKLAAAFPHLDDEALLEHLGRP